MQNLTCHQEHLVNEIFKAISIDPNLVDYKCFLRYLKDNKNYWTKCILVDNKYLYGSLVQEAKKLNLVHI